MVKCRYPDCEVNLPKFEVKKHENICEKKIIVCEECKEELSAKDNECHSCIKSILYLIKECNDKLKLVDNELRNDILSQVVENDTHDYHIDIICEKCNAIPIIGTRNVCLECPNYNLC